MAVCLVFFLLLQNNLFQGRGGLKVDRSDLETGGIGLHPQMWTKKVKALQETALCEPYSMHKTGKQVSI
jgi:hypothetical protein